MTTGNEQVILDKIEKALKEKIVTDVAAITVLLKIMDAPFDEGTEMIARVLREIANTIRVAKLDIQAKKEGGTQ